MSRYIFSKNNRWYISEVFDPSDSKLQEKASYYTLTDDVTGPYYAVGTSDSASIGVSYVPVVQPAGADVTLGVVDSQGRFQALKFNGTQASNSGSAIEVQNYKTWDSTLPAPQPSGGSMEFYKCSYVNSNSWGGYKAVHDPVTGIYSFESDSISGLSWGGGFQPDIGKVYADGALVRAALFEGIPTAGLVFHAPLNTSSATAATGQTLNTSGTVVFSSYSGINCARFSDGAFIRTSENSGITGQSGRSVSFWAYPEGSRVQCNAVGLGDTTNEGAMFNCGARLNDSNLYYEFTTWYNDINVYFGPADGKLHHFVFVYPGSSTDELIVYVDKVAHTNSVSNLSTVDGPFYLGRSGGGGYNFSGYLAAVRVYNRVLTQAEIGQLYAEFTTTA